MSHLLTVPRSSPDHTGLVLWFTGLSGAGKSTLAQAVAQELHAHALRCFVLDGDVLRQGLNRDLGYTPADRSENMRRVAEVARLMSQAGLVVLVALISPYRKDRTQARAIIGPENFLEVFVDTPLSVCEARDPKGLYQLARQGKLPHLSGIGDPYEPPENADVVWRHDLHPAGDATGLSRLVLKRL